MFTGCVIWGSPMRSLRLDFFTEKGGTIMLIVCMFVCVCVCVCERERQRDRERQREAEREERGGSI